MMTSICVVGLGFVGLTTALGFAEKGYRVIGMEQNPQRKASLVSGNIPFHEPGLSEALKRHLNQDFFISDDPFVDIGQSDFIFLCVETPLGEKGEGDMRFLREAFCQVLEALPQDRFPVVIVKSTVPIGTHQDILLPILQERGWVLGDNIGLAQNPEFLREGSSWLDFIQPDRIVLGINDSHSQRLLAALYEPFSAPIQWMNPTTAEYTKYLSNALLATLISFSNEMSLLAEQVPEVEIIKAFKALHADKRWFNGEMKGYVWPGCGFGGACLPKDIRALEATGDKYQVQMSLIKSVIEINQFMPMHLVEKIEEVASREKKLGVLGLSFKPGSDDVRGSVAVPVIEELLRRGYRNLLCYDPLAAKTFQKYYPKLDIKIANRLEEVVDHAEAIVVLLSCPEFHGLKQKTKVPIIDGRHFLRSGEENEI